MPKLTVDTTTNGQPVELYYEDHGAGKPVVLIHGWPLSGRSWEAQVPALIEAGYRVISYDRRGFGWSSQPYEGYEYDRFSDDLAALLDHLELTDATIVGFSMGGGEVVRYLARHGSSRIAKAVLAGAVPPYLYKSADNPDGGLDDATIAAFQAGVTGDRAAFLRGFANNFYSVNGTLVASAEQVDYAVQIANFASPKGTLDCITAFGRTDFRGDLPKIDVPTLVIHGDADAIVPFEVSGKRAAEAIADSTVHVIAGGPHGINVTHAEEFNTALIEFLGA